MTTLREAAQQALRVACMCTPEQQIAKEALRTALAQPEPRNQCGETCERAKLCAVCARGLEEQEPATRAQRMRDAGYTRRPTLREMTEQEKGPK